MRIISKKAKKSRILVCLIVISLSFLFFPYKSEFFFRSQQSNKDHENLKTSSIIYGRVHILDNWSATVGNFSWCTGSGTSGDPYIIQDITINGNELGTCLLIENSSVYFRIDNCTFFNSKWDGGSEPVYAGIKLKNVNNGTVINNTCYDNKVGINLDNCKNITVAENSIDNINYQGIRLDESNNNTIASNNVTNCGWNGIQFNYYCDDNIITDNIIDVLHPCIKLYSSNNNKIIRNTVHSEYEESIILSNCEMTIIRENTFIEQGFGFDISGGMIVFTSQTIDSSNTLNGKPIYYYSNENSLTKDNFTNPGQIILAGCDNNFISDITIFNSSMGISMFYCDNNEFKNITMDHVENGIMMYQCDYNDIIEIFVNSSGKSYEGGIQGIFMDDCNYNNLIKNNITRFAQGSIALRGSYYNNISGNYISENYDGIYYENSNENLIHNNIFESNTNGILFSQAHFNNITNNLFIDNSESIKFYDCQNNSILNNDFLNNGIGVNLAGFTSNYNNTISSNLFNNNYYAIYSSSLGDETPAKSNFIINNNISNSHYGVILSAKDFYFSNNLFENCGIYLGGKFEEINSHKIDTSNKVNNKAIYYYVNETHLDSFNFTDPGQIILVNCNNSRISNFNIFRTTCGISLHYCADNNISHNNISDNNACGIRLENCYNITVLDNSIDNIYYESNKIYVHGIFLVNCHDLNITENKIINSYPYGIYLEGDNHHLSNNLLENCGVYLSGNLEELRSYEIDTSNKVNGKDLYYYKNKIGLMPADFVNPGQIILINCNNSLISNLNLAYSPCGIFLSHCMNNTITNVNSSFHSLSGIELYSCINNVITNNIIQNNTQNGIRVKDCFRSLIYSNNVSNSRWYGIDFEQCQECNLSNNYFVNNDEGIGGGGSYYNISNNTFINNYEGISVEGSYYNISNNTLINNYRSIDGFFENSTLYGNQMEFSEYGTWLDLRCSSFYQNTAINNTYGFYIQDSKSVNITDNIAINNSYGFYLHYLYNSTIERNLADRNEYGIFLNSENSVFTKNVISNNNEIGIETHQHSSDTIIFNNIFVQNKLHAYDIGSNNHWNNSLIGNYWDNYLGSDTPPFDGIGDTPYIISGTAGSIDFLPIYTNPLFDGSPIHIDGSNLHALSWERIALVKWWSTGSGSISDPYLLKDLSIDGQNSSSCIFIENTNTFFRIEGCNLINSASGLDNGAIKLKNVNNSQLINNTCLNNNGNGIYLSQCHNNIILGNLLNSNEECGILLEVSSKNTVSGNVANNSWSGIYLSTLSTNNTVLKNNVSYNYDRGIFIDGSAENRIIENMVNNNGNYGIYLHLADNNTLSRNLANFHKYYGIIIKDGNYNIISQNNASLNGYGIGLSNADYSKILTNIANNNIDFGIDLENSNNNMVSRNTANKNNNTGIRLWFSDNNTITENSVNNNSYYGIYLINSSNNLITNNNETINYNGFYGIYLNFSHYNNIIKNVINYNGIYGIYLYGSNYNYITENVLIGNKEKAIKEENCRGNIIKDNIIRNGKPKSQIPLELIIILYIVGAITIAVIGGVIVWKIRRRQREN